MSPRSDLLEHRGRGASVRTQAAVAWRWSFIYSKEQDMKMSMTRRALVQRALTASALVSVAGFLGGASAYGESPALDSSDPTAKALGYVPKSAKPNSNCANCSLFQGKAGDAMGPCRIFPGRALLPPAGAAAGQRKPRSLWISGDYNDRGSHRKLVGYNDHSGTVALITGRSRR